MRMRMISPVSRHVYLSERILIKFSGNVDNEEELTRYAKNNDLSSKSNLPCYVTLCYYFPELRCTQVFGYFITPRLLRRGWWIWLTPKSGLSLNRSGNINIPINGFILIFPSFTSTFDGFLSSATQAKLQSPAVGRFRKPHQTHKQK